MNRVQLFSNRSSRDSKAKELAKQGIKSKRSSFGCPAMFERMYLEAYGHQMLHKKYFNRIYELEWND